MSDDVEIKKEDLDAAEKEVLESSRKREEEIRSNIEAKLRKEMEDKKKAEEEAERINRLEEENKAFQKMLQEEREKTQKELEELRSKLGSSKAVHIQPQTQKQGIELNDDETLTEIQRNSEQAFLEHYGLPRSWRGKK